MLSRICRSARMTLAGAVAIYYGLVLALAMFTDSPGFSATRVSVTMLLLSVAVLGIDYNRMSAENRPSLLPVGK